MTERPYETRNLNKPAGGHGQSASAGEIESGSTDTDLKDQKAPPDSIDAGANFVRLAGYQILIRIGWIFKTESIIMPALMDLLCGPGTALAAWMRSWLPQINRFGQSIPQLVVAGRLRNAKYKKYYVAFFSGLMGMSFLMLALIWHWNEGSPSPFMRSSFLVLYGIFFVCVGINNLGFNTLQGKLIRYNYRGRFFLVANTVGGLCAILAASFLLTNWLEMGNKGIIYLFACAGSCFLVGSLLVLACREQPQAAEQGVTSQSLGQLLWLPVNLFRKNHEFRRLAIIAACFGTSMVLFPHYQALYRSTLVDSAEPFVLRDLVLWVIIQNAGTIFISWCAGPAADRFGNRIVLQLVLFLLACAPLLAIWLSHSEDWTRSYYFVVFLLVGVTPVTIRVLNNFTLELAPEDSHPQFLSALSLCIAAPVILFSQIIGLILPILGFQTIFIGISIVILAGWSLTFSAEDPRRRLTTAVAQNDN